MGLEIRSFICPSGVDRVDRHRVCNGSHRTGGRAGAKVAWDKESKGGGMLTKRRCIALGYGAYKAQRKFSSRR